MIFKNCDATVPTVSPGDFTADDEKLLNQAKAMLPSVRNQLEVQSYHEALETIWVVIRAANVYVDHQAPWKLRKEDPERMNVVLYVLAETVRYLGLILHPFMPASCDKMLDLLCIPENERTFAAFNSEHALKPGTVLPKPEGVFPRHVEEEAAQ
jgi:methionyl-tRNA synthetase